MQCLQRWMDLLIFSTCVHNVARYAFYYKSCTKVDHFCSNNCNKLGEPGAILLLNYLIITDSRKGISPTGRMETIQALTCVKDPNTVYSETFKGENFHG